MDSGRPGAGGTNQAGGEADWNVAGVGDSARVAFGVDRVRRKLRRLHAGVLDATTDQIVFGTDIEQHGGIFSDDSVSGGFSGNGGGVAELGPAIRTEVSRSDTRGIRGDRTGNTGCTSFDCDDDRIIGRGDCRNDQHLWTGVFASERIAGWIGGGGWAWFDELDCECGGICGSVRCRMDQPANGQFVWKPGGCWDFVVRVRDAGAAAAEERKRK